MRLVLILSLLTIFYFNAFAQGKFGVSVLPQIGITYSDVQDNDDRITYGFRAGKLLGSSFILDGASGKLGALIGIHYVEKGGHLRLETRSPDAVYVDEETMRLSYVDASFQARGVLLRDKPIQLFIRGGLIYSFGVKANGKGSLTKTDLHGALVSRDQWTYDIHFVRNPMHSFEQRKSVVSGCIGLGIIIRRVVLDIGYSGGPMRIKIKSEIPDPVANNLLQVSVGYTFRKLTL